MKIIADTHTHTLASTHAYSTLTEMVHAAAAAGLSAIAVTDHGISMPGAPGQWYFKNMQVLPRVMDGVLLLRGIEANVMDYAGTLDIVEDDLETLEWVVASIHDNLMDSAAATVERCTEAWLQVAKNPKVNVIGHSGSPRYAYDYETVIPEFGRMGKLVELNENSFRVRKGSIPNCIAIAKCCKKHGVPMVVNSDAHFHTLLGHYENSLAVLEEIGFPEELVVNSSMTRFQAYLKEYTQVFSD